MLEQLAYGKASNTDSYDEFSIVSLSGDTLAVGALLEDSNGAGSGAVYVFRRTGFAWVQEAYLKASNSEALDLFGSSVSLSGDTLVVGAPWEDSNAIGVGGSQNDNSAANSGAVYVFRRTDETWAQEAYVKASNTDPSDNFGFSVSLSGDTLAVGALAEGSSGTGVDDSQNDNSVSASGAVYVFKRTGNTWAQEAYVKASNTGNGDRFGRSVSLSGDTLAVGTVNEESSATGIDGDQNDNSASESGAVYVFKRTGNTWVQEAYVKASNTDSNDYFGVSVSISGDTLAIGSVGEDSSATGVNGNQNNSPGSSSGAVYVFTRTGQIWTQQAYIKASNTDSGDGFGASVSLVGDVLAVGTPGESSDAVGIGGDEGNNNSHLGSGAVYVFSRAGSTWIQEAYLKASNTDHSDKFGHNVSLSGGFLAVGANQEDSAATGVDGAQSDNSAQDSGAVYIFE